VYVGWWVIGWKRVGVW